MPHCHPAVLRDGLESRPDRIFKSLSAFYIKVAFFLPMNYVYIIQSTTSGKFYIGYTKNLQQRISQHQEDRGGWTKGKGPWVLKYYETFELNSEARKREIQLKKKKRPAFYEYLIMNGPGKSM